MVDHGVRRDAVDRQRDGDGAVVQAADKVHRAVDGVDDEGQRVGEDVPILLLGEELCVRIRPLQRIDEIGLHRNVRLGDEIGVMPLAEHLRGLVVKHHAPGGAKKRIEFVHAENDLS